MSLPNIYRAPNTLAMLEIAHNMSLSDVVKSYLINWLKAAPEQMPSSIQKMTSEAIWKTGPYANLDQATAENYTAQAAAAAGRARAASAGSAAASAVGQAQEQAQAQAEADSSSLSAQMVGDIMALQQSSSPVPASGIDFKKVLVFGGLGVGAWWILKKVL